jgi:hypothetical protein
VCGRDSCAGDHAGCVAAGLELWELLGRTIALLDMHARETIKYGTIAMISSMFSERD